MTLCVMNLIFLFRTFCGDELCTLCIGTRGASFFQRMGDSEVTTKRDGEHSTTAVQLSPTWESTSNGEIVSAVQEVEGENRSVKSDLEHKLNAQIDRRHPNLALLPRCSEWTLCWCRRENG